MLGASLSIVIRNIPSLLWGLGLHVPLKDILKNL